jgi:hypothetical protein
LFVDRSAIAGVLSGVRNSLLDWVLELEKKGVEGEEVEFTEQEKKKAQEIEPNIHIDHVETFSGNIGDRNDMVGKAQVPEGFLSKFFWYVIVALIVLIVGNIISALILKYLFGIL